jgi:periplasmic protein TonB
MAILHRRASAMASVLAVHGFVLTAFWFVRVEFVRHDDTPMTVSIVHEQAPILEKKPPVLAPVRLVDPLKMVSDALAIDLPIVQAAPVPAVVAPVRVAPAATAPTPSAPETLGNELAVQCPERSAPHYPPLAKRQREQGEVRLRVELDETGRIDRVTVISSSGSPRLDEAARAAIESWRCRPALRDGHPVRAIAMQSLDFVLERH